MTTSTPLPDPRVRPQVGVGSGGSGGLVDRHGRVATDLRVSLTDRCNLRCTYCMPPEGLQWLPK
ncbi:MAG: moaA, partial [Modestobacter sp.]|nr:moaA [Modestobacter sp.]